MLGGKLLRMGFQQFLGVVRCYQLGDIASLVGLLISIGGFGLAFGRIRKLQTASEQARAAAEGVREQILQMNAIQGLNVSIRTLEDIRRLHRLKAWPALPDRYTSLKQELFAIRGRTRSLSEDQRSNIQAVITQLSTIERQVESTMAGGNPPDIDRMNDVISRQIDRLAVLLVEMQNEIVLKE
jgi:hypothetical protein